MKLIENNIDAKVKIMKLKTKCPIIYSKKQLSKNQ